MKNKIEDLRNHLFAAIEGIMDEDKPLELDKSKAVAELAQVIINSAKVEVDYMNKIGGKGTNFIPNDDRLITNK